MKSRSAIFIALVVAALPAALIGLAAFGGGSAVGAPVHLVRLLVYAGIAIVASFLCSVAEAVLLTTTPSFVAQAKRAGRPWAPRVAKVKRDIDQSLAGILTLNTIAHTVGAGGAGAEAAAYFGEAYVGVAMAVLTLLILFLSEIVPKTLGAVYWRRLAPAAAWFVQILIWVLYPFIWVSDRLMGWITGGRKAHAVSREEVAAMAELGAQGGHLDAAESRIVRNVLRFPELRAEDVMTPRTVVFALQRDRTVSEVLAEDADVPFSRIPVYGENRDDPRGFVLKTDLLLAQLQGRGDEPLSTFARDLAVVPESASLERVADVLLDQRRHLLAVLDAYGGLAGVVSLEDVVETLIGIEIVDEADTIDDLRVLARRRWRERMEALGIRPAEFTGDKADDSSAE